MGLQGCERDERNRFIIVNISIYLLDNLSCTILWTWENVHANQNIYCDFFFKEDNSN